MFTFNAFIDIIDILKMKGNNINVSRINMETSTRNI